MQAAASANLCHRRLEHLNNKSLDLLKSLDNNDVSFDGPVPDCDVCAVGKSHELAYPKTAYHKVKLPSPARFRRPNATLNSRGPRGFQVHHKYLRRAHQVDEDLFAEVHARLSQLLLYVFVQYLVIPSGFHIERLMVDKGGKFISKELQGYCLQRGVSREYASTNTPQQIGMSERVGRPLAAIVRCMLADSGLPKFL